MFLEFYELREQPFGVTPDPRFLYLGEGHREALAAVYYSIETRRGFSAIIAEPGMGKTSLLLRLLESLQTSARTAFLFQTEGNSREFLQALLRDLGITKHGDELTSMYAALNEVLLAEMDAHRRVVVVVDEAQNLSDQTLELVRLLSNFETPEAKLMHIVLAGQPKLEEKLSRPTLIQLRQRVGAIAQLRALRQDETVEYIQHRLRSAGHKGTPIFTTDAYSIIGEASKGIPRNINNICFHALSLGFANQSRKVGADITNEVVSDLGLRPAHNDRVSAHVVAPKPAPAQWLTESSSALAAWPLETTAAFPLPAPSRSPSKKVTTAAIFAAIPLLCAFALKYHRDGLNEVADRVTDAVSSANADIPLSLPTAPKLPPPPELDQTIGLPATPIDTNASSTDEQSEERGPLERTSPEPLVILTNRRETAFDIAHDYSGGADRQLVEKICDLNPAIRSAYEVLPSGTKVILPNQIAAPLTMADRQPIADRILPRRNEGAPTARIQIRRPETLFQVALEQYGKSNWGIIERIRALNPQIHDSYQILSEGEWVRLPQKPLSEAHAETNARAGAKARP
jgi:type II secretory pathway predicted ATPase ExeA/phage tail protein X